MNKYWFLAEVDNPVALSKWTQPTVFVYTQDGRLVTIHSVTEKGNTNKHWCWLWHTMWDFNRILRQHLMLRLISWTSIL